MTESILSISERATELHSRSLVVDMLDVSVMDREHLEHMRAGGVTAANVTLTKDHGFHGTVDLVLDFEARFDALQDLIRPVRHFDDIARAKDEGRIGIIYGLQNATPIEGDLRLLEVLHNLGIRVIQLAYMTGNLLGDGCLEPRNAGLTFYGNAVVREMNRLGILIDLSHCGERTSLEAVEASDQPVAITHACAQQICHHARNKSDRVMKAVADRGGMMGVTSLAAFVADDPEAADLSHYLDHIDYAVETMGIDHVGIGLDLTHGIELARLAPTKWGGVFLPTGLDGVTKYPIPYASGIDNSAKFGNVTDGLLARGYAEEDVQKILGLNFLALIRQVWRGNSTELPEPEPEGTPTRS